VSPKLRVLISDTYNPWFNIATEDWIFREMDPSFQTLYLWRNEPTVVVGRSQNPWSECNLKRMEEDGVFLARRASGGGAVFHDLGNTCFTFLSPRQDYNRSVNGRIILAALKKFGISADLSGRNDIVIPASDGPRKVSGSAFRETHDRAFQHGTLLIKADLTRLGNYLTPNPKKLQSKGKASVRSRVANLSEENSKVNHDSLSAALIEEFFSHYGSEAAVETLNHADLALNPSLQERFAFFSNWDWRYGKTPEFQQQMSEYLSWGFVEVYLDFEKGTISRAQVFSDSLFPELIESIPSALCGKAYNQAGIDQAVNILENNYPQFSQELREFAQWLKTEIEA
jgi:lipoate-protein ligase A